MSALNYLRNEDFMRADIDGALTFDIQPISKRPPNFLFNVRDEGDIVVIESLDKDPGTVFEPYSNHPDTWKKSQFAGLGNAPEISLVREAEERFGQSYSEILKTKRTIGAMTTLAFVFDDGSVKIAVVQRTSKGPDGTPNMGALSRFGGGVCGGRHGKGVHGAKHLGNQTVRELLEEFHPYIRSESGILTPIDIIPQGYEVSGLKGEFMTAVMGTRAELASRINTNLEQQGYKIGTRETMMAVPLSVPSLTKPLIQIIDGQSVRHDNVVTFDAQIMNRNMDFNIDHLFAVRVRDVQPEDLVLKDGETDQKTNTLLNRIIFFGDPEELRRSVAGEIIQLHPQSDMTKSAVFSDHFIPILKKSKELASAALERVM